MELLHFGTLEPIIYKYVKLAYQSDKETRREEVFAFDLLSAADPEGITKPEDRKNSASSLSRFKGGKSGVPDDIAKLFRKFGARDTVVDFIESLVEPLIHRADKQHLVSELLDLMNQDSTIPESFKQELRQEARPETLPAFLADLLIYAVGVDPRKVAPEYPFEFYGRPLRNDWFTGRDKELEEIQNNFQERHRIQIIHGMGGMGKSQIAQEYAYENCRDYAFVHWVDGSSIESIAESYKKLLSSKDMLPKDTSPEAIIEAYTAFMDKSDGWLIIYDNCDYFTDGEFKRFTKECLPKNPEVGNILITTRVNRPIGKAKRIEINTFTENDAVVFILQRTESEDEDAAKALAERLGYFPLALEIASAYIRATPGCDIMNYLEYLEDINILNHPVEALEYKSTISDIVLLTLNRIVQDYDGDDLAICAETAVRLCAYFAPNHIDLKTFAFFTKIESLITAKNFTAHTNLKTEEEERFRVLAEICEDTLKRNDLTRLLVKYALLRDEGTGLFCMHELQQEMVRLDTENLLSAKYEVVAYACLITRWQVEPKMELDDQLEVRINLLNHLSITAKYWNRHIHSQSNNARSDLEVYLSLKQIAFTLVSLGLQYYELFKNNADDPSISKIMEKIDEQLGILDDIVADVDFNKMPAIIIVDYVRCLFSGILAIIEYEWFDVALKRIAKVLSVVSNMIQSDKIGSIRKKINDALSQEEIVSFCKYCNELITLADKAIVFSFFLTQEYEPQICPYIPDYITFLDRCGPWFGKDVDFLAICKQNAAAYQAGDPNMFPEYTRNWAERVIEKPNKKNPRD